MLFLWLLVHLPTWNIILHLSIFTLIVIAFTYLYFIYYHRTFTKMSYQFILSLMVYMLSVHILCKNCHWYISSLATVDVQINAVGISQLVFGQIKSMPLLKELEVTVAEKGINILEFV